MINYDFLDNHVCFLILLCMFCFNMQVNRLHYFVTRGESFVWLILTVLILVLIYPPEEKSLMTIVLNVLSMDGNLMEKVGKWLTYLTQRKVRTQ